jgi:hypothetical protein
VITEYFQAINDRNYAGYLTTESPDNALTAEQFQAGYESTVDSNVLVTSISTAPDGRLAADVTFTSRQQPQDGPDGESCTDWQVTMFFDDAAGNYTIGMPRPTTTRHIRLANSGLPGQCGGGRGTSRVGLRSKKRPA